MREAPSFPVQSRNWLSRHLTLLVILALIAAVLLGYFYPATAVKTEWMGKKFIMVISWFIPPIIFVTIVSGISGMSDLKKVGRIGIKSLLYFEIVSTISLAIGILVANLIQPGRVSKKGLPMGNVSDFIKQGQTGFDWKHFFLSNLVLQVLVIAIIVGIVVNLSRYRHVIVSWLEIASKFVFLLLRYVMYLAPLGAFGGMASMIGKYGISALKPLALLMISVYSTMILFVFVVLGLILRYYRLNIWSYLKNVKEEILIVLGTSSSETALPSLMNKLEQMGCDRSVVGLVVPTGYSFNLDGTSIYLSMATIFLAQLYNIHLTTGEMLAILGILMVTSKGAAGVTGSGFIILASTLAAVHKIPLEGLAFLFAIDKFMSEARAITNIIGNGVATLVIAKSEGDFVERR
jgi:aerobic C4-dicarboxylate transport protein